MRLDDLIDSLSDGELRDRLRCITGSPQRLVGPRSGVAARLRDVLLDRDRLAALVRSLSQKLRDVLIAALAAPGLRIDRSAFENGAPGAPIRAFEYDAAAAALVDRALFAPVPEKRGVHEIPFETGTILRAILCAGERPVESFFSLWSAVHVLDGDVLRARLGALDLAPDLAGSRSLLVARLADPGDVHRRFARLPDAAREPAGRALRDGGGILSARAAGAADRDAVARALEANLLGSVAAPSLVDFGLSMPEPAIVLFAEVAEALLDAGPAPDAPPSGPGPADCLADLGALRTVLESHEVKLTREGEIYRATLRRLEPLCLLPGRRPADDATAFAFLLGLARSLDLLEMGPDRRLVPSARFATFERLGVPDRARAVRDVLVAAPPAPSFHQPRVRIAAAEGLAARGGAPARPSILAALARNRHLAHLERRNLREAWQKRFRVPPFPSLATPDELLRDAVAFLTGPVALAGLAETWVGAEGVLGIRITPLGRAAFLPAAAAGRAEPAGPSAVVSSDFEVVVLPDGHHARVPGILPKFARRTRSDVAVHYQITRESVEEAVADGLTGEDIVGELAKLAGDDIPPNVERSVREWCARVGVATSRPVHLVTAPSPEILDRMLGVREFRDIVLRRIDGTSVAVSRDPALPRIASALREGGLFVR